MSTVKKIISLSFFLASIVMGYPIIAHAVGDKVPLIIAYESLEALVHDYSTSGTVNTWKIDESDTARKTNPATGGIQFEGYLRQNVSLFNIFSNSGGDHDHLIKNALNKLQAQCVGLSGAEKVKNTQNCHSLLITARDIISNTKAKIDSDLLTTAKQYQKRFPIFALLVTHNNEFGTFWSRVIDCINKFSDTLLIQ